MAWVLKTERHYMDGTSAIAYHKGFPLGIMHELTTHPEEARKFNAKKDADAYRKEHGMSRFEIVKAE